MCGREATEEQLVVGCGSANWRMGMAMAARGARPSLGCDGDRGDGSDGADGGRAMPMPEVVQRSGVKSCISVRC